MTLLASFTDLEQLVWEDIQSDGLGVVSQADSDSNGTSAGSPQIVNRSNSAFLALGVEEVLSAGDPYTPSRTSGDAGSGTFAKQGPPAGMHAPSSQQPADVGPFAALEHQQRLDPAPSGCLHLPSAGALLTQRSRALAAAAGSLRTGAVGSNLRLAALMYRSNSGGLADTLLSEQARAESGLLMAGLPRSDSLPELNMPLSAAELVEMASLKDMDLFASMPSAGLPTLSMLFNEPTDIPAAAHACQHDPASSMLHDDPAALRHAPASAWTLGRMMMRPSSFTALTAPAMFGGSSAPAAAHYMGGLPPQTSGPAAGYPSALQPPTLVDYSCMVIAKEPAVAVAGQLDGPPAAAAAAVEGFPGLSQPSHSRLQPLLCERQDTFELLMRQMGQEMVHEAQVQQYAALELDTMDVPTGPLAALPAAATSAVEAAALEPAFLQPSVAEAAVPAVLAAAAAAAAGPGTKRRSVFELKRPSAFEAAPAHLPAPEGPPAAAAPAQLEPVGPSFASWAGIAPADLSTSSQVSDASAATAAAAAAAVGAATGGCVVPTSPFCLPTNTGLLAGDSSAATDSVVDTPSEAPEPACAKQEVARYSRVLTCKTYLKRLNITQAMAEHLLPPHDLSAKPQPRASSDGGASDDEKGSSTYGTLFKDHVTIVDEHGTTYRVQYEGVSCNAQKHLRLTCGWRDYIRRINAEVGDSVVFERRGNERIVLYVTLVKASEATDQPTGPASKKRRIGRKQAVQRLE